jgi:hypothetical protein
MTEDEQKQFVLKILKGWQFVRGTHGCLYDRGSADSYYSRIYNPHYYVRETGSSPRVPLARMTPDEIVAYTAGYNDNEDMGDYKEWL